MKNILNDNQGIAYIWALAILSLLLAAVLYFPLSYVWDTLYTDITGGYTFTGNTALGIAAVKFICSYLLGFVVIAVINWMLVNAKASSYD
jgi:accessory gene regulator protein AgrB